MKRFNSPCAAVLAGAALLLSACGGGGGSTTQGAAPAPSFSVGGSITGLANASGLTLVNGTETLPVATDATAFTFANRAPENSAYSVRVGSQPTGLVCNVNNASGSVAQADVRAVAVVCKVPFTVSTLTSGYVAPVAGSSAKVSDPRGVATDAAGNIYAAELFNCSILKITPLGVVTTLAGGGTLPKDGGCNSVDGVGADARFNYPRNLAVDTAGNVFVSENGSIRKVTQAGVVTTLYRNGAPGFVDAAGASVQALSGSGIAIDGAGALYVAANHSILKIAPGGLVTTLAGSASAGYVDGAGGTARFNSVQGVAVDSAGNVYVADQNNDAIRKITPQGQVTSLLKGRPTGPVGVAVDSSGNVYAIGDRLSQYALGGTLNYFGGAVYISNITSGLVTKVGGTYTKGPVDGPPATAQFNTILGIAVDGLGNIYVTEYDGIRKVTP